MAETKRTLRKKALPDISQAALLSVPANFAREILGIEFYPWQADEIAKFADIFGRVKSSVTPPNASGKS